jgi:clan AA aspartic protease
VITGIVNANREPTIQLRVGGPDRQEREIEAIIDTGFNGFLTLPPTLIAALDLPRLGRGRAILANGREAVFDIYETIVTWDGRPRPVEADATGTVALVGMSLLDGHDLWIHAVTEGRVTVEAFT